MPTNSKHLIHKKSNALVGNAAKLPTSSDIVQGEIAINYKKGYETISTLNDQNEIVEFASKNFVNAGLSTKADTSSVYTKTEVDTALSGKADASSVYTKTEADNLLSAKADASSVYTKSEVDTALSGKADASSVYTKSEVDTALSGKAYGSDTKPSPVPTVVTTDNLATTLSDYPTTTEMNTAIADFIDYAKVEDGTGALVNKTVIGFYHGGSEGTKKFQMDASAFVVDGMVDNVEIKNVTIEGQSVTCLVITFNTEAGKNPINIPLTQIFDPSNYYTKTEANSTFVTNSGLNTAIESFMADDSKFIAGSNVQIAHDNTNHSITISATDTTYGVFNTTTDGLVPKADGTGETNMFLKGDGTWAAPTFTIPVADSSTLGGVKGGGANISIDSNGVISATDTTYEFDGTYNASTNKAATVSTVTDAIGNLATVATSGSYNDLSNKPTIPAAQVNADWNATSGVAQILNKPSIPAAQVNADWDATSGVAQILNKPTIPAAANDGTFKINSKVGNTTTEVGGTSANASNNTSVTLVQGSNVTLTTDATNKEITIAATDTTYESKSAASGGTAVSLVTTGEKYTWNSKQAGVAKLGSTTKPVYTSAAGTFAECSTYAGGTAVTLNGSSKAASTASFYAPTGAGTNGQYLKSNGSGAPSWTNFPTIPSISLNGSTTTTPSFYAPTSYGTSGYYLKANGSGSAPTWTQLELNMSDVATISVEPISANKQSSCTITGGDNIVKSQTIIYTNSGSSDLTVTVPTTYKTPDGAEIILTAKAGGYCEVNYLVIGTTVYARGL